MTVLIIDSSYLIFRSYFAYPHLNTGDTPTGAFFGFAKTTLALIKEYSPEYTVFAKDLPTPTWRHLIHKEYKAGRPEADKEMIAQIPIIHGWSQKVSKNCFAVEGFEADDIIFSTALESALDENVLKSEIINKPEISLFSENSNKADHLKLLSLSQTPPKNENQVYIFSSDKDLFQLLILPNIYFIRADNKGKFSLFGAAEFIEKYQVKAIQWLDYKALVGDGSDNLKGLNGIGPKTATKILNQIGNLYSLAKELNLETNGFDRSYYELNQSEKEKLGEFIRDVKNQKFLENFTTNYDKLKLTYNLGALQLVPKTSLILEKLNLENGNEDFVKYNFKSLLPAVKSAKIQQEKGEQEELF